MTHEPSKTTILAWARLMKAQRMALAGVERALKQAAMPPLAWYDALLELERAGEAGLRPFELERDMLLEQYNLSRLIDRMEKAGYVARRACADDRRGQLIVICPAGRDMRQNMWPAYAAAIQAALGRHLSQPQAAQLSALLGYIIDRPIVSP